MRQPQRCGTAAWTLVEVLVGIFTLGLTCVALYTGFVGGFNIIRMTRENLRATQIMLEKMETVRLYNWDQINSNGFIVAHFTEPYYSRGGTNMGAVYTGTLLITNTSISDANYTQTLRSVAVDIHWSSGRLRRHRSMQTYVSQYGLQNYVY